MAANFVKHRENRQGLTPPGNDEKVTVSAMSNACSGFWKQFISRVDSRIHEGSSPVRVHQNRLLHACLIFALLFGPVLCVLSDIKAWQQGLTGVVFIFTGAYAAVCAIILIRPIPYRARAICLVCVFFLIAVASLWAGSVSGSARLWFIISCFSSCLLLGFWSAAVALLMSAVSLTVYAHLVIGHSVQLHPVVPGYLFWSVLISSFIGIGGFIVVVQTILMRSMQHVIDHQTETVSQLRLNEQRYRDLLDNVPDVICHVKRSGSIAYISPLIESVTGAGCETLIGSPMEHMVMEEDIPILRGQILAALSGAATSNRFRLRSTKGEPVWVKAMASAYRYFDEIVGVLLIIQDISEQTSTRQLMEMSLFSLGHTQDAIYWIDKAAKFRFANDSAAAMLGYEMDKLLTLSISDIDPNLLETDWPARWRLLRRRKSISFETFYTRTDGVVIQMEVSANYVCYGNTEYCCAVVRDITQRKKKDTRLREIETRLQVASRLEALGSLASGVAHDFNNILAAITGYSELSLLTLKDDPRLSGHLYQILKAAIRAKDLVQQIVSYSRPPAAKKESPVQIDIIIKEVLKLLRSTLPAMIKIEQFLQTSPRVLADPTRIYQLVMNLCVNAAHAMEAGGGTLTVSLSEESHNAVIAVQETGTGMAPEMLEQNFSPNFTTKGDKGTGLGLATVLDIVTAYQGTLRVDSRVGWGSRFSVNLPMAATPSAPAENRQAPLPVADDHLAGKTVLYVEDETSIGQLVKIYLEQCGYKVIWLPSPVDALAKTQEPQTAIDVVVTDLSMPGMRGDKLAARIAALRPDLPIILYTGHMPADLDMTHIRAVLIKPVVMSQLAAIIATQLRGKPDPAGR